MVDSSPSTDRITRLSGLTGTVINDGRIKLIRLLGSGSYGTVYLAGNIDSNEKAPDFYAVKCQLRPTTNHEARLLRIEIELHSHVSGLPNILILHGVLFSLEYVYFVMDYCPGGDLFDAITENRLFARNDLLIKDTLLRLLDALQSCHDAGIAHRDIKPENVLCNIDGSGALLTDFGLATWKRKSRCYRCGTYSYMSPECIARSGDYYLTHPSDIWSLGILFFNMLTGVCPWEQASPNDLSYKSYLHAPDTYFTHSYPISQKANDLLRSILHPDPSQRGTIDSIRDMTQGIETFYMTKEELARASQDAWMHYVSYAPKRRSRGKSLLLNGTSLDCEIPSLVDLSPVSSITATSSSSPPDVEDSKSKILCVSSTSGKLLIPAASLDPRSKTIWSTLCHLKDYFV